MLDRRGKPKRDANGKPHNHVADAMARSEPAGRTDDMGPRIADADSASLGRRRRLDRAAGRNVFQSVPAAAAELGNASAGRTRWLEHVTRCFRTTLRTSCTGWRTGCSAPADKINHALVLGGAQGIGKDTLLEPVKYAVGPWNFHEVSPGHLLGQFNGFVKSVILRVNEARDLGDVNRFQLLRPHEDLHRGAAGRVAGRREAFARILRVQLLGFIITTNHKTDGIYLPADDRRHYVAWSQRTKEEFTPEYWNKLWGWYRTAASATWRRI